MKEGSGTYRYFDRDLSWLSFNERILMEASRKGVPVVERLNFLGIFSSNLDEFYRVRMPAILALKKLSVPEGQQPGVSDENLPGQNEAAVKSASAGKIRAKIGLLLDRFGSVMQREILPNLLAGGVDFKYQRPLPEQAPGELTQYFYEKVAGHLEMNWFFELPSASEAGSYGRHSKGSFFPRSDQIYLLVKGRLQGQAGMVIIRIPVEECGRFWRSQTAAEAGLTEVWLLDDIIRMHLQSMAGDLPLVVEGCYSFKLTRDADVDYKDEYGKDLAGFIQRQIAKRNFGLATRLLYDQSMPAETLSQLVNLLNCRAADLVPGGCYHNLKDLLSFPAPMDGYVKWPPVTAAAASEGSLLERIFKRDVLISTPYEDYGAVLRFFNEAAIDPSVHAVGVTLYRIASNSLIAHALMTAAKNGKKVTVFVELKARFDESNNIKWARKMRAAGVKIVYSIWALKVHAKVALVRRKVGGREQHAAIVATGNFNENTARLYADYVLMTACRKITADIDTLMLFLSKRARPDGYQYFKPQSLLIAGFNLLDAFLAEIRRCSEAAKAGRPAEITIKLNNLEERRLIDALYQASTAGVKIRMMVRSICRLVPGVAGMSENISVYRLVDRYLEHSRVFIFNAGGVDQMYIGSADWMNRNIYRRIEVCCPVTDEVVKARIGRMVDLQFEDELHLVRLTSELVNEWVTVPEDPLRLGDDRPGGGRQAQRESYLLLAGKEMQPSKEGRVSQFN